jgi:trimeric autotransporter adhesin
MKKTAFILGLLSAVAFSIPTARADQPNSATTPTPSDWSGIRSAHETWKHRFEKAEDGSFLARNPGQQWSTRFDGRGFLVEPAGQDWRWGLQLNSYGVGEIRSTIKGEARVETSEERLSYRWNESLEEWFLNDTRGMEQGWTFTERPTGATDAKLRLDFGVRGGLESSVRSDGRSVAFSDETGEVALNYGGLKAWDASGRDLPVRFLPGGETGSLSVEVDERGAVYPVTIDPVAQQARLKADNAGGSDAFGSTVAISGDTVAVAARFEAGPGDALANSGAVYVFVRSGATWTQQAYLRAFNAGSQDQFGLSLALSGDTLAVGAPREDATAAGDPSNNMLPNSGAVYTYTRSGTTWTLQSRLKAPNAGEDDEFGQSVALSGDFLAIGAPFEDSTGTTVGNDNNNGFNDGAVYVYTPDNMGWALTSYLKSSTTDATDLFGSSLALSGNTLAVGAPVDGSLKGRCAVFTHDGANWTEEAILSGSNSSTNDTFGISVAISGDTIVVGAPYEDTGLAGGSKGTPDDDYGAAYVFQRTGVVWSEQAILQAGNRRIKDNFGEAVAIAGDLIVVGAQGEDNNLNGMEDSAFVSSGAAYLFERNGAAWTQRNYLKGSNSAFGSSFGRSVAIEGTNVMVGASGEDDFSGAVYSFILTESVPTLNINGKKKVTVTGTTSKYTVKGTAGDADGDLIRVEAMDSRTKGAKMFRPAKGTATWSYRALLKPGRNSIQVVAVDATGARSKVMRLTVIRK